MPATIGADRMRSSGTSLRYWARGLRAPLTWFFQAMRVMTSFNSSSARPYLAA